MHLEILTSKNANFICAGLKLLLNLNKVRIFTLQNYPVKYMLIFSYCICLFELVYRSLGIMHARK